MTILFQLFFISYLIIQSFYDIKYKMVPIIFNKIAVAIGILAYFINIFNHQFNIIEIFTIFITIISIVLMQKFNIFGSGDTKAMIAILLSMHLLIPHYPDRIFPFLCWIFTANVLMIIIYYPKQIITKTKIQYIPYFPFLLISFLITNTIFQNYIF